MSPAHGGKSVIVANRALGGCRTSPGPRQRNDAAVRGIVMDASTRASTLLAQRRDARDRALPHPTVPMLFCSHCENAAHSQRSIVPARQHR